MNKTELTMAVAENAGLSKKQAEEAIKATGRGVSGSHRMGKRVLLNKYMWKSH